jgi:V8-like Glu-specific endopeptidase
LNLSGHPEVVTLSILDFLEQFGRDRYGYEALGRFLNVLTAGNYIGDEEQKSSINAIVQRNNLIPPTTLPPPTPEPRRPPSEETLMLQESIIGENTLRPIAFLMRALEVSKSVCFIAIPGGSGTGFVISDDLILTNHHVIKDQILLKRSAFRFNYQLGLDGLPEQSEDYAAKSDGIFFTNKDLDYTIVQLENMPGKKWGQLVFNPDEPKVKDRVNIIQHAGGEPKRISIQNNFLEYIDNTLVQYLASTLPGSSGSPVFDDDWRVIALHHSGGMVTEPASGRRYFRNEGIRLSAIMKDLPNEISDKLLRP